ncbi:MAG TPA: hypothetical protein VJL54_05745 [Nitrososphaera sp.]|jgi:hypothetical protein|nr:hypothetical protein [Nitrososphaera sp.]
MLINSRWFFPGGCGTTAQTHHEKPKKSDPSFDEETIRNMVKYCKVEEKNFDALIRYIRNRGIAESAQ